ncbi:MAG: DNA-formamidopyrimidine glycosylase family protein [Promethearchaeati archaeon SRVP18_Atabeyarchaeia-1]
MPELPDLEYLREFLTSKLIGVAVEDLKVMGPIVVRSADPEKFGESLKARRFESIRRRGKYLLFSFDSGALIVISPMLSGRLHYRTMGDFDAKKRFFLSIILEDGAEIRYSDDTAMGRIYLLDNEGALNSVLKFAKLGTEALDTALSLQKFATLLKHFDWEVKRVLTYQSFIAGIGNAYSDEVLFDARINPFRRCNTLSQEESARLYNSMRKVLTEAIKTLRKRVGENIEVEVRDFMKVHGKGGQPCPTCGTKISEVKDEGRKTNFCRNCQPGSLFK